MKNFRFALLFFLLVFTISGCGMADEKGIFPDDTIILFDTNKIYHNAADADEYVLAEILQ